MAAQDAGAASAEGKWQAFLTKPATYIHKDKLVAMFGGAMSAELCERIAAEPRLLPRMSALVESHYALPQWANEACEAEDRAIVMMAAADMAPLIRRAGAIHWSASIAAVVLAPDIRALYTALGDELCAQAVRHRDLSGPVRAVQPLATLAERVDADGRLCLAAWVAALPAAIGERFRLKWAEALPSDEATLGPFRALGPATIRRAASM
jgi:hypothetical protein